MANLPYWLIGILAGLASSVLYAGASAGASPALILAYLAPLPIFIAGLGWGTLTALIAGSVGLVVMALLSGISGGIVFFSVAALAPIWLVRLALMSRTAGGRGASAAARAARAREAHHQAVADGRRDGPPEDEPAPQVEWYPPGMLVVWTTAIAAALLVVSILSMMAADGGIRSAIVQMINTGIVDTGELRNMLDAQGMDISAAEFLTMVAAFVPATAAGMWLIMTLANMLIAQLIVSRSGLAARPTPDILGMSYPQAFLILFPVSLVLGFLPGELGFAGVSLAALLFVPYLLLGLVTIHAISRGWQGRPAILAVFYVALALFGWLILLVGILGLVEAWMGLRARYGAGSSGPPDAPTHIDR
ncbi:DUF2232 domain-containing protein [Pyruvatibacter sp.]|uniref:DUF2232 domain-containing protein n=1 Tax=Pyruvatibacter sp. TaxID=1981328 RepID=UPI0032ED83DE